MSLHDHLKFAHGALRDNAHADADLETLKVMHDQIHVAFPVTDRHTKDYLGYSHADVQRFNAVFDQPDVRPKLLMNPLALAEEIRQIQTDMVERPLSPMQRQIGGSHYKDMTIQPVEYITRNGLPFLEGCIIKCVSRWRAKGGVEDLKKAHHFIEMLIMYADEAS